MMGRFVIVAYTPKPKKEKALLAAVKKHLLVLAEQKLITEKPGYVMRANDGTIIEVFEWRSSKAIEKAHSNTAVQALWKEFGAACTHTPLAKLEETSHMFAEFDSVTI
jgi:hypothetical protein